MTDSQDKKLVTYTVTEIPLDDNDIKKLNKTQSDLFKINIILLPLLILIYFWGLLYFLIYTLLFIAFNFILVHNYDSIKQELKRTKIVITGMVTKIEKDEETILSFADENFDITYANADFKIEVNDRISIHYSKKANGKRGRILKVERAY